MGNRWADRSAGRTERSDRQTRRPYGPPNRPARETNRLSRQPNAPARDTEGSSRQLPHGDRHTNALSWESGHPYGQPKHSADKPDNPAGEPNDPRNGPGEPVAVRVHLPCYAITLRKFTWMSECWGRTPGLFSSPWERRSPGRHRALFPGNPQSDRVISRFRQEN
uniref:Uncharacterized protein n=1 Tax=Candidatus Kentrum sp. FM TaxID=2126340 RepID=A0A450S8C4_9GAMM|nr:MAG: hypothetical protein BECKFM1743C_GA0114222_100566 [Candidatus Kentron sp. FM]VFJ48225.1 MAG: hypothetical protein BECKFM1743A_GA0114220_100566 [Candidatus Kentron sp. FM]